MKSHFHTSKAPKKDGAHSLLDDINETRYALETAYNGFDNATDPDLIDCYIYEMNSILKRYRYLLHQARNPLFEVDPIELTSNPLPEYVNPI